MRFSSMSQRRLVLVLDGEVSRVRSTAEAVRAKAPGARVLMLDAERDDGALTAAVGPDSQAADAVLVRASPASWAVASVLAAYRQQRLGRQVDAFLVAEGPLEQFPVLITDFPGLRLLPPDADVARVVADQVYDNAGAHV
jgi:hypothetical protein